MGRTNSVSSHAPQDSPTSTSAEREELQEARTWFVVIDQNGDGELSDEELHFALLNNGSPLFPDRPFSQRFSVRTVKYLVSIFDQNGDGVIGWDEFAPLWKYLNQLIQTFYSFDENRDGLINTTELGHALANYGLHLSLYIVDAIMNTLSQYVLVCDRHVTCTKCTLQEGKHS
ncbi:hypothetical protein BJV77DRAFT_354462 [Russula vinacea]|nr:hypothetical protein BJV77DRAFT_354462 [Russula vinacea]